jgi:hypothetical protein
MLTERGEIALALNRAAIDEQPFPADVPDTPRNRELFGQIVAETEDIVARGLIPDIPAE